MTVADLIQELRRFPAHKPVRVVISEFQMLDEAGDYFVNLSYEDAEEIDAATDMGSHILIRGRS